MEGRRVLTADFTKGSKSRRTQNIVQAIEVASAAGLGEQPDFESPFDGPGQDTEVLASELLGGKAEEGTEQNGLAAANAIAAQEKAEGETSLFVQDQLGAGSRQDG